MRNLKGYLIITLMLASATAHAQLPPDADRTVDVELAGFLFSQGIYKTAFGDFKRINGKGQSADAGAPQRVSIPSGKTQSQNDVVQKWMKQGNRTIPAEGVLDGDDIQD